MIEGDVPAVLAVVRTIAQRLRGPALNRRRRTVLLATVLGAAGVAVIVLGITQTGSPAAAPLPLTTVAPQPILPTYAYPTAEPTPLSTTPTALSTSHTRPALTPSRLDAPIPVIQTSFVPDVVMPQPDLGPSSIRIPALGVTASIGAATVVQGVLTPPRIPNVVGDWAGSAPLNAKLGEVTLAGHVNWGGMPPFAFGSLAYLHPGNIVYTTDPKDHLTAWRITSVVVRSKDQNIDPAAFGGTKGPRRLAMITCGGAYDVSSSSYVDNVYAYANPA